MTKLIPHTAFLTLATAIVLASAPPASAQFNFLAPNECWLG
jgi:hypothetical protein